MSLALFIAALLFDWVGWALASEGFAAYLYGGCLIAAGVLGFSALVISLDQVF